jgi:hypothetical protein
MSKSDIDVSAQILDRSGNVKLASYLDVQRASFFLFILLFGYYFCLLVIPQGGDHFLRDPDIYWHVALGKKIWETRSFPYFDELSHTFGGQPWIAKEWLGQLFLFTAYSLAGWRGVVLLSACVVALTYALVFLMLGRTMRLTVAIGVATVAFVFSWGHFNARPLILVDPLIVLWVASLVHAVENQTSPNLLLLPLMTLWANLHGSFTFGLAIGAALAAEAIFVSKTDHRPWTAGRWTFFIVAALGFACITPYGYRPIIMTFKVFSGNDALHFVNEWRPVTIDSVGINEIIIFGLLFMTIYNGVRLRFWRLTLTLALIYLMFAHIRFSALFAIVTPFLVVTQLTEQFQFLRLTQQNPSFFESISLLSHKFVFPACALIVGGLAMFGYYGRPLAPAPNITPTGAVDYILREHLGGNIYNPHNFGGYLISRGLKTFIDGRNDQLFSNGFVTRLHDVVEKHPKEFVGYLKEYNIAIALVFPDSIEAQELERSFGWKKVYSDAVSELFQKESL